MLWVHLSICVYLQTSVYMLVLHCAADGGIFGGGFFFFLIICTARQSYSPRIKLLLLAKAIQKYSLNFIQYLLCAREYLLDIQDSLVNKKEMIPAL